MILCQHCGKVAVDPGFYDDEGWEEAEHAADMWSALLKDVNAEPCKYPDLRDSLHDWIQNWRNSRAALSANASQD